MAVNLDQNKYLKMIDLDKRHYIISVDVLAPLIKRFLQYFSCHKLTFYFSYTLTTIQVAKFLTKLRKTVMSITI